MTDGVLIPGEGLATAATDFIGGQHYQRIKPGYGADGSYTDMDEKPATEATLASALAALVSIAGDDAVENLLRQLLQAAISPAGFDRSLGRGRVTAIVESGTVTTVTTVTTVSAVSGLTNIDGRNGGMLINQTNLSAWADCVRARIT